MKKILTKLSALPLNSVWVTDEYCKNALEKEVAYLLSLEEGRLLAGFFENAGIATLCARYGGWESGLIGGHTLGHYLSAVSQACKNPGVTEGDRARLLLKVTVIVDGLAACQEKSGGFIWGAPPAAAGYPEAQFDNVEQGKTNIKREAWVPWYTMHKILAGLIDAYRYTEYPAALDVARKLGDWIAARVLQWNARTRQRVLAVEYGGMNDCLYELYAFTGEERYALAAHVFDEEALFDRILTEGENVLNGLHANTTIPKIVGALNRYLTLHGQEIEGKIVDASRYLRVAEAFFRIVSERHTYVTGGNSEWEHFGKDYLLDKNRTNCNCETCNVYNMLKLARGLFCVTGDTRYTDYYDNAFTNAILSSQNPETGMTTYFQPMASGFFKVYSRPYDKFWCCSGSGMENFTKLGDSAIYTDGENLYLEQYLSMRVRYGGIELETECDFPLSDTAKIIVRSAKSPFILYLRLPDWADDEPQLVKNGAAVPLTDYRGHTHVQVQEGDELAFRIPVAVSLKGLPDGDALAFRYGGAVLSADFGTEDMTESETGVDVTISARRCPRSEKIHFDDLGAVLSDPAKFLVREGDRFFLRGADVPLEFGLHYKRYRERYAIYLRLRERGDAQEELAREPLDTVQAGYGQYEADDLHALEESGSVSVTSGATYRYARAGGHFSYDFLVDPKRQNVLTVHLLRADNNKTLRITAGGTVLFDGRLLNTMGEEVYARDFEIPAAALSAVRKKKVNGIERDVLRITFSGARGRASARVCGFINIFVK